MDLRPSETAVLAVHFQRDIVTREGALGSFFADQVIERDVINVAGTVLAAARAAGATVIYTRFAFHSDYSDLDVNSPILAMTAQIGCLVDGTPMAAIVPELEPGPDDVVLTHKRVGAFASTGLDALLFDRGINALLVAGVPTNMSVENNVRAAGDLGYRVVLIEDACAAATMGAHKASVAALDLLCDVASSTEVVQALRHGAAR